MRFSSSFITKRSAFSDSFFWLFVIGWAGSILAAIGMIFFNFRDLPNEIPLFYGHLWGAAQLAKKIYIYLPITGAFILGVFNFSWTINFHSRDRVFAYLFAGTATLVAVLCAITTINIVNLIK